MVSVVNDEIKIDDKCKYWNLQYHGRCNSKTANATIGKQTISTNIVTYRTTVGIFKNGKYHKRKI